MIMASRYGERFDLLADRWGTLEREHDEVHPDRNDCGGVGGCLMMRHATDLMQEMEDVLEEWRAARFPAQSLRSGWGSSKS
jgi:hypothetical protein